MHLKTTVPDTWAASGEHAEKLADTSPTQLLSLAIKKRKSLYEAKEHDFRKELLHTGMIQTLCRFLGEGRARKRRRRHRNGSKKRRWDERSSTESEYEEEHNGEWSGNGPTSPKRSPDPISQTSIQTWVGGEPNRSSSEDVTCVDGNTDHLVPMLEVCEESGPLKRLPRFNGTNDEDEQRSYAFQSVDDMMAKLCDQQLQEGMLVGVIQ